jgi:hypothetical protein
MTDWSLEHELCQLSGEPTLTAALVKLGAISGTQARFSLYGDSEWSRGGAETYLYRFWVHEDGNAINGYLVKACVAFSAGSSIDAILKAWIDRREQLARHGISTPRLLGYGSGILVEELVPYDFRSLILEKSEDEAWSLILELATLAGVVSALHFRPTALFSDLRSRGNDVVMVDFGEDLGAQDNACPLDSELHKMVVATLREWGIRLSTPPLATLCRTFEAAQILSAAGTYS